MDTDSFIVCIKQKIFIQTFQKILRRNLILQIINFEDHCLKERKKKVIALIKDELGGKVVTTFVGLRPNMHSSVTYEDCNDKNK